MVNSDSFGAETERRAGEAGPEPEASNAGFRSIDFVPQRIGQEELGRSVPHSFSVAAFHS